MAEEENSKSWRFESRWFSNAVAAVGRRGLFTVSLIAVWAAGPRYFRRILEETNRTIWRCVLPVCAVAGPFGMVIALQGSVIVEVFGAQTTLPSLLVIIVLREIGPLVAGLMLALQAGSGYAGELGTMRVKEELDALNLMGVHPLAFQVFPRVAAITLAAPVLCIFAGAAGILAGRFGVISTGQVSPAVFNEEMFAFMRGMDIWGGLVKAGCFGLIIGIVCCFEGYSAGKGARGVAEATNRGVIVSVLLIVACNYLLSSILYGVVGL